MNRTTFRLLLVIATVLSLVSGAARPLDDSYGRKEVRTTVIKTVPEFVIFEPCTQDSAMLQTCKLKYKTLLMSDYVGCHSRHANEERSSCYNHVDAKYYKKTKHECFLRHGLRAPPPLCSSEVTHAQLVNFCAMGQWGT